MPLILVAVIGSAASKELLAARSSLSVVYVSDMHCAHCAKKIASSLYTVAGVSSVQTNVKQGTALITPSRGKALSPRALWEAVENVEFTPVKLIGPSGSFDSKPSR